MLYLCAPADAATGADSRVPLSDRSALSFERALLATSDAARAGELAALLADDSAVAACLASIAAGVLTQKTLRSEELAAWWSKHLAIRLTDALASDRPPESPAAETSLEWRLPALAARLADFERQLAEFDARLEREKLESLKELAYGASHEINNPLANIAARAQSLLVDETDPERRRKLLAMHRQSLRAHEMISDLMLFARPPKLKLAPCDIRQLVMRSVEEHRAIAAERDIELRCELADDDKLPVMADETQIAVAVGAVVLNAIEAVGANGRVQVSVRTSVINGGPFVEILVSDDGPGISEHVRQHMFDPFFSGREAGRGLGFGLTKCWRIVTDHGGQVVVYQSSGHGGEISILLPIADCAIPS